MISDIIKRIETNKVGPYLHLPLYALSLFYGAVMALRGALYSAKILKSKGLPVKVVCVGNISTGGTGKTPVTMYIAKRLVSEGLRPVILSRGYKGRSGGVVAVSDGDRPLVNPERAGDEPYLMASELTSNKIGKGVPVVVGADRVKAGRFAVEQFAPDVIILDDGFQHLRLRRDMDIVLYDPSRGECNDYLLPRGLLREKKSALKRAHVILVKGKKAGADIASGEIAVVSAKKGSFYYRPARLVNVHSGTALALKALVGSRVFVFAGIADPASFISTISETGAVITGSKFFEDHNDYSDFDVTAVITAAKAVGANMILTTEKDAVKLRIIGAGAGIHSLGVEVAIADSDALIGAIKKLVIGRGFKND